MFKRTLLVLGLGAAVLAATTGANADIIVTPISSAASYDLAALGAIDYWTIDGQKDPAGNGSLDLTNVYNGYSAFGWPGPWFTLNHNVQVSVTHAGYAGPIAWAAGPTITAGGVSTTGYNCQNPAVLLGANGYQTPIGFTVNPGGQTLTLHFIVTAANFANDQSDVFTVGTQPSVTAPTFSSSWTTTQFYEITAVVSGTAPIAVQVMPNSGYPELGFEGAWVTPEPATMALLAMGGVGMLLKRRRTA